MRLRLDSLAAGGEAVGRGEDGRAIFVDGGVPGDVVEVVLTQDKRRYARGTIGRIIEPGSARVEPPCVHANECGGCPWQMVSAEAQLAAKEAIVRRALQKIAVEVRPIVAAPTALGYRVRATMYARSGRIGYYARRSHALVAIDRCLVLDPALEAAMRAARNTEGLAAALGEEGALRGTVARGLVQLAFVPGRGARIDRLHAIAAALAGVCASVLVGDRAFGPALLDAGDPERPHWVSALGFRQANEAQNQILRASVAAALEAKGTRVLELYAGDGNFTRDLAGAAQVTAVEEDAAAVARLRQNLPAVEAICARVEDEVQRRLRAGARYDRVLLDPPRAGAKDAIEGILRLAPERIVYISCDPATLARDLVGISGYRLVAATPFDLMPHADHVEVLVQMVRT